jgi:hypothetical protein
MVARNRNEGYHSRAAERTAEAPDRFQHPAARTGARYPGPTERGPRDHRTRITTLAELGSVVLALGVLVVALMALMLLAVLCVLS